MKIDKFAAALIALALAAGVARHAQAQTLSDEHAAEDLREAEAAGKRHRAELMKIPHVRVVTGELDSRHDAAILIEVDDQKFADQVTRQLPSKIEGFPVEVDEQDQAADLAPENEPAAQPTRFPTIDKMGIYHHTWLKPAAPAPNPDPSQ
jgi:hypothetical protein